MARGGASRTVQRLGRRHGTHPLGMPTPELHQNSLAETPRLKESGYAEPVRFSRFSRTRRTVRKEECHGSE